jgi:NDP-sugar pyrophosphorylase family protein
VRDTLKWAARMLYYLGFDYEDIVRDMGSLAELAELERDVSDPFLHV